MTNREEYMTLLDVLEEEKVSFEQKPFDVIDAFVLSVASYLLWENSGVFESCSSAGQSFSFCQALGGIPAGWEADIFWFNEIAEEFKAALMQCSRYETVRVSCAVSEVDPENLNQFAAVTFHIPKDVSRCVSQDASEQSGESLFVSFRGTDSTVTGWEEDFLMAVMSPIPSQVRAQEYLDVVASANNCSSIYVGGHSKGGNLAFYSAKNCSPETQTLVRDVYSFDGPGFSFSQVQAHREQQRKRSFEGCVTGPAYHKYVPSESVFGKLFYDLVPSRVVKSSEVGLMQHQPFSWLIEGRNFVFDTDTTVLSHFSEHVFDGWIDSLSQEEKIEFLGICFGTVDYLAEMAGSDHVEDLPAALPRALPSFLVYSVNMDEDMRQCLNKVLSALSDEIFSQAVAQTALAFRLDS